MSNERDHKAFTDALEQFATQYGYKVTNIGLSRPPIEFFGRSATDLLTSLNGLPFTLEVSFRDMKGSEKVIITPEKTKEPLLSLHEAPSLPKLTAEVFDREDCPTWAKYAAVDADGDAFYYEDKPRTCEADGEWLIDKCIIVCATRSITGNFDPSDWQNSLIERPEKKTLPEWCKVGKWVYHLSNKKYCEIVSTHCIVTLKEGDGEYSECYGWMQEKYIPARIRPYNTEEMKALVGRTASPEYGTVFLVTKFFDNSEGGEVCVDDIYYNADRLLDEFTINDKPAGVLEHLENGEWVE